MDTLTKSCSPTIVITANGEVQTHEEAIVYVKELDMFLTMKVLDNTPAVLSLGKLCDEHGYSHEWINGQKPHLNKNGIRLQCNTEPSFRSCPQACLRVLPPVLILQHQWHLQERKVIILHLPQARLFQQPQLCYATGRFETERIKVQLIPFQCLCHVHMLNGKNGETRCCPSQPKKPKPNKNENHELERRDPCCSEIPEWLQEFRESLVDDWVPERRDPHANSSHEPSLEPTPTRSVDLGEHSVCAHFPKDRNCEICKRTKITRAPCRRRNGGAVPRAENFGDLKTADHKVLSEGCESRNNHRYAVVVQNLTTQWIQSYPCKTETSQETRRSLQKFLEPERKPKVINTDTSLEFGKACEDLPWIIARLHHTDRKHIRLLK